MFLKKKQLKEKMTKHLNVAKHNDDTTARIKSVLASVNAKSYTVLAIAKSDSGGKDYEIRMGSNHAVFCTCKGWQYSKTGTCKHLERLKQLLSRGNAFIVPAETK